MMRPRVLILSSALDSAPRVVHLARPMTVGEIVALEAVPLGLPTIAVLTDPAGETRPVMRGEWHVRQVPAGHQLAFVPVPGRGSLSSILAAVAGIALAVVAPWAAGAIVGAMGLTGTAATLATSLITGGIMIAGQFLINRLLPPPTSATADAVFSARASSNRAMPLEPIPALYGRMRYAPPYAARPYAEYVDNEQYLYQLHCLSIGVVAPERWEIGETLIWTAEGGLQGAFAGDDAEIEIVRPGDEITLFPANVVTASTVDGQQVPDAPDWLGPFAVSAPGIEVARIACDYVFPLGLIHIDKKGRGRGTSRTVKAEYRAIDDAGNATGDWSELFSTNHSASTRTPQRFSRAADVELGRYEVRFGASGADHSDDTGNTSTLNRVMWAGLRGYVQDFVTPPDCTLVATRIRATEQLSREASGQYLWTCQRLLPVWSEEDGWSEPVATRSPAWAAADVLRRLDVADADYDLPWLAAYAGLWEDRGDRFDGVFDRRWQASEALDAILRVGRAYHVRQGWRIGFNRDEPKQVRRMAFTPDTVVRGSIQREDIWFSEDQPDSLKAVFLDGETWREREVVCSIGSVGSAALEKVTQFGITSHGHSWREGIFLAAENAFRRSFRTFQCEREGRMVVRGDPVVLHDPLLDVVLFESEDSPGRKVDFARLEHRAGDVLTLDRPIEVEAGETYHLQLRDKYGREWGPCLIASIAGKVVTLDADDRNTVSSQHGALTDVLPDTARQESAHVSILKGDYRLFNGLVVEARPVGSDLWEITLVNDDQRVHTVDETELEPAPWTPPALTAPIPDAPVVAGVYANMVANGATAELHAGWHAAVGAERYVAEISYDEDALASPADAMWEPIHGSAATRMVATVQPEPLTLRVAAIGRLQGPWAYRSIDSVPTLTVPPGSIGPDALMQEMREMIERARYEMEQMRDYMRLLAEGADEVAGRVATGNAVAVRWRDAVAVAMSSLSAEIAVKARIYRQPDEPEGEDFAEGDIWFDTDDDNFMRIWSAADGEWQDATSLGVTTYAQDTPPTGARPGDIWIDTTDGKNVLHRFDGNDWVEISDERIEATASALTAVQAAVGDISADGLRKIEVQAGSGNVVARLVDMVRATVGDVWVEAGTIVEVGFVDADPSKPFANYLVLASKFGIIDPNDDDATVPVFSTIGGRTYINLALIGHLTADQIDVASLMASNAFVENLYISSSLQLGPDVVITGAIASGAITETDSDTQPYEAETTLNPFPGDAGQWLKRLEINIHSRAGMPIFFNIYAFMSSVTNQFNGTEMSLRILVNNVNVLEFSRSYPSTTSEVRVTFSESIMRLIPTEPDTDYKIEYWSMHGSASVGTRIREAQLVAQCAKA